MNRNTAVRALRFTPGRNLLTCPVGKGYTRVSHPLQVDGPVTSDRFRRLPYGNSNMLPIYEVQRQILQELQAGNRLVLTAPTGSGKTTQVPQMLYRAGLAGDGQIVVLQPRRLATRLVARRVAHEMKCELGSLVGYQTRHERCISAATQIRFMTEGLLLRLLQSDPRLTVVQVVILDEFHERNLPADIALGLVKRLQESTRPDLKLVVMSATLDAQALGAYLNCPMVTAGGRLYPVDISYLAKPSQAPIWDLAANALGDALRVGHAGDVLIFMPGVYEINRTIQRCEAVIKSMSAADISMFALHGNLSPQQQDAAIQPGAPPNRKVVVATNVAETSITIEGIGLVIDSGLARIHRYEPRREINVLRVEPISRASADQRAGRAGRLGPGICQRLWTQADHAKRAPHDIPEVQRVELSETVLQLKSMGVVDISHFPWLQAPRVESIERAEVLLKKLGGLNATGDITAHGRMMSEFPTHPRLSHFMLDAARRGCLKRAMVWAAIINEGDFIHHPDHHVLRRFQPDNEPESDLLVRELIFEDLRVNGFDSRKCHEFGALAGAARDVNRTASQFEHVLTRLKLGDSTPSRNEVAALLKSLLLAFDEHLAMKIDAERPNCQMTGRKKVLLDRESVVRQPGLLLALDVREVGRGDIAQSFLSLASHIEPAWLHEVHPSAMTERTELVWNDESRSVEQVRQTLYNELEIARKTHSPSDAHRAAAILVDRIVDGTLRLERWDDEVQQWILRTKFVARIFPERKMITYDEEDVRVILHEIVGDSDRFNQIRGRACLPAVKNALSWHDQQWVDQMAPEHLILPSGKRMKLEYQNDGPPRGRARIQDLYGLRTTPRIAGGRQELLVEILAPNLRPVQVTTDLANFWRNLYPELKKELQRRYPKHKWL